MGCADELFTGKSVVAGGYDFLARKRVIKFLGDIDDISDMY